MKKKCLNCNSDFDRKIYPSGRIEGLKEYRNRRYCSHKCYSIYVKGRNHHNYKDGLRRGHDCGYLRYTNGEYVHRVKMEQHLGRKLKSTEHIHHIDGNPTNNKISNLKIVSNSEHRKIECQIAKRDKHGRFCK